MIREIVVTKGIDEAGKRIPMFLSFVRDCMDRFFAGDYGEMCEEDLLENTRANLLGERVVAMYETELTPEKRIYIIADAEDDNGERVVTIMFPREY